MTQVARLRVVVVPSVARGMILRAFRALCWVALGDLVTDALRA
jgi:hypothetical protein